MKWSASLMFVVLMLVTGALAALYLQGRQEPVVVERPAEARYAVSHAPLPGVASPEAAHGLAEAEPPALVVPAAPPGGNAAASGEQDDNAGQPLVTLPSEALPTPEQPAGVVAEPVAEALPLLPEPLVSSEPAEIVTGGEVSEGMPDALPADDQPVPERSPRPEVPPKPAVITGVVSRGDTAADILHPFMDRDSVNRFLRVSGKSHSLANLRAGQAFEVIKGRDGSVETFAYEIDRQRRLVIEQSAKGLSSRVEPIAYDTQVVLVNGTITSSLFQAFTAVGESPNLTMMLADIFASEINFIKDLRKGDRFVMLVEKRFRHGEFKHYGRVLGARFINRGKTFEAFRYAAGEGGDRFYTGKGESLQKVLLQSPLSFTRITSNYSLSRKHPVFFDQRPHEGVDYGAPTGTPVKAVGDAQVTKAGWGNGFGNMVVLRHSGSLESMYSHLSGFAKGVKSGVRVKQGQVIGYVGATGVATGPHLDFRLKQNGKYVNPTKAVNPRAEALAARRLREFEAYSGRVRACLDGRRDPSTLSAGKP